jgi:hypothetical protein
MANSKETHSPYSVHRGPHPGIVAIVHVALFMAAFILLGIAARGHSFQTPFGDVREVQRMLFEYADIFRINAFLQFGASIPLGIFTAAVTSRLSFLGVNVTGISIALVGGITAVVFSIVSALCSWVLTEKGVAENTGIVHVIQLLGFSAGGVGYASMLGLLMAGVSVPCLFGRYTPKWVAILGLALAVFAELSIFSMVFFPANIFLPIARFGSYVWMIATGFTLVKSKQIKTS